VDDYLSYLHERHPTSATFDGIHTHDDLLEDFSRASIDAQIRELGDFARRLAAIEGVGLSESDRLEKPAIEANIRSRLYELETVRSWERSPQFYADIVATTLAGQVLFEYAPVEERARRINSKLRQVPRFIESARDNIRDAPGIFMKVALETLRGTIRFIEEDLPLALTAVDDLHLLGDLADGSQEAVAALRGYADYLERDLGPRSRGSFRLGKDVFEEKIRLDEGLAVESGKLLEIAMRELRATQEEFKDAAARLESGEPVAAWRRVKEAHPNAGELVPVVEQQLSDLLAFIDREKLISVPDGERVLVAPTPRFYRWTFASMWAPGPFEPRPLSAYYYITDVDSTWPTERQIEHMRDLNYGALWAISIHEVYPGHFLHYQHLRRVESKFRKSILFASSSFIEGWAHYVEQMMMEAGFGRRDDSVRLGQLVEALIRLCRLVVGIRLHAEDLSVEQGVRIFREEAYMEEGSARREAERGTFDPGYVVYSIGKLMLLKLREEYRSLQGGRFSLRAFHDALLANGTVPFRLHRQLLLGADDRGALIE
jgi:hypothetical protein